MVAAFVRLPWDTEGNQPKTILLTAPTTGNPENGAWDILASELGLKTRQTFRDEHEEVHIHANMFVGTEDVETEVYTFDVRE